MPDEKSAVAAWEETALPYIVRLTCLTWLAAAAITWRTFISSARTFPPSPVIPLLHALPGWMDWLVFGLQIAFLLWLLFAPHNRRAAYGVIAAAVLCMFRDLTFLQPYTLMYIYTLLAAGASRQKETERLNALRIMVAGVYFWAGFHKQNLTFYSAIFPWFIEPIYTMSNAANPTAADMLAALSGVATPVFELMIGVQLLFPARRKIATGMAFVMLSVVLICLGPLGHNWGMVVWPWNIYLFLLEMKLFFRDRDNDFYALFARADMSLLRAGGIAAFMIAPVFAIYSVTYAYVGFKLYSGNIAQAEIVLPPQETMAHAPERLKKMITQKHTIRLIEWSVRETGHAPFPIPYVFRTAGPGLCRYLDDPKAALLRIYYPPPFYSMKRGQEEAALCP